MLNCYPNLIYVASGISFSGCSLLLKLIRKFRNQNFYYCEITLTIAYFLEVRVNKHPGNSLLDPRALDKLTPQLSTLPHITGLNIFTPVDGCDDPYLNDDNPPVLTIQILLHSEDNLGRMLESSEFTIISNKLKTLPVNETHIVQVAMMLETFMDPATTTRKTVSYLVNYQRPAEDEEQFIRFYREHHPPIMLRFPGLRRLELGIPVNWQPAPGIDIADRMLFCEVSFDDIYQLNKALASDIRIELRRDYEHFPPFSGTVTHFPMRRQTLI